MYITAEINIQLRTLDPMSASAHFDHEPADLVTPYQTGGCNPNSAPYKFTYVPWSAFSGKKRKENEEICQM